MEKAKMWVSALAVLLLAGCGGGGGGGGSPGNRDPVISNFTGNPASGNAPLTVKFTWNISDPDGDPLTSKVDFGDGSQPYQKLNSSATEPVQHTYQQAGNYTVTLTVTDERGGHASQPVQIRVSEGGGPVETATVQGRVIDAADENVGVPNALVSLTPQAPRSRQGPIVDTTDANGFYQLENVQTGKATLEVRLDPGSIYDSVQITLSVRSGVTDVDVRLVRKSVAGALTVQITQKPSGSLRVGDVFQFAARVTGGSGERPSWALDGDIGRINSDGFFTATKEGSGIVRAYVGTVSDAASVQVQRGETLQTSVTGRVLDRYGDPGTGATVRIVEKGLSGIANNQGYYTIVVPNQNDVLQVTVKAERDGGVAEQKVWLIPGEKVPVKVLILRPPPDQPNHNPTIEALSASKTTVGEGETVTVTCQASDPDHDPLTYEWAATGGTITGRGREVNWEAPTRIGSYTISCTVRDDRGGSASRSLTMTVSHVNRDPQIQSLTADPTEVQSGQTARLTCQATDLDGDRLTFTWDPEAGTIQGSGATVTWQAPSQGGTYAITCVVDDGQGGKDAELVSVTVNAPPVIASLRAEKTTVNEEETIGVTVQASDPDRDPLTFEWTATGGTLTGRKQATGSASVVVRARSRSTLTGQWVEVNWKAPPQPDPDQAVAYTLTCTVRDNRGGSDAESVTLNVVHVNKPPTIQSLTANPADVPPGGTTTLTCQASDPEGKPLTFVWKKTAGTLQGSGATVTWTAPDQAGSYTITCEIQDDRGAKVSQELTATVTSTEVIIRSRKRR